MLPKEAASAYWAQPVSTLLAALETSDAGLTPEQASQRLEAVGHNTFATDRRTSAIRLFVERFRSPLVLILVVAAAIALLVHEWLDAIVILSVIIVSACLSFVQEFRASRAIEQLQARIAARCTVLRAGQSRTLPAAELVPGDIVLLSAGSLVPADGILLETRDLFVSQSVLTGETFPIEKHPGVSATTATLPERSNCVFMGTSVRSGTARVVIVHTGRATEYGRIADRLAVAPQATEFERGLRHFGGLLVRVMLVVVLAVLSLNILLGRPTVETLLFAMALAVGLSPELLPAVLTATLARGAQAMARHGVIVRRLNALENLGSMDILCTDKTGTLTEGRMILTDSVDALGHASPDVLRAAYYNAGLQTGMANPLDEAIVAAANRQRLDLAQVAKLDEIPYDFLRKRLTIVVRLGNSETAQMLTKGAFRQVLDICDRYDSGGHVQALDDSIRTDIEQRFAAWSTEGYRVLGLARRDMPVQPVYGRDTERDMIFSGFLLFFDPPRDDASRTLQALRELGVQVKIITGDNELVACHVASAVGMDVTRVIRGADLANIRDEALWHLAPQTSVFAEVDPNQKERIIRALQRTRHVVGYLGDGINDAPALHAADVGLSVDSAADVARDAADFVLLKHSLDVLRQGIEEGRHTFANTIKYIFITTSANFGNMISLALASLFLPFLPLLAIQILLNNFLSDLPAMGIAGDNVDREWQITPHRWDMAMIRYFMVAFGLVSSAFDLLTFATLLFVFQTAADAFRTGWFIESLLTEILIMLVVRTHRPFYQSRPGRFLLWSSVIVFIVTLLLPYLPPLAEAFMFVPLPPALLLALIAISGGYVGCSELTKRYFYRRFS